MRNKILLFRDFQMSLDDSEAQSSSTETQKSSTSPSGQQKPLQTKPPPQKPLEVKNRSRKLETETSPTRKQETISSQSPKQDLSDMSSQSEPNTPSGMSKTVDCEICGKPFGRNSLQFHTKQCRKKFQAQVRFYYF